MSLKMFTQLFVLLSTGAILPVCGVHESYSVSITTEPSQGPFRIGQRVQFSCVIEPTPPDPVTYHWTTVDFLSGRHSHTSQTISILYYPDNLRYCWYFCEVSVNEILVGSASKLIELHGFLHTGDPVVRSFNRGERLQLIVNISNIEYFRHNIAAKFITSLAWYHNGTRIISGNKFAITDNETTLSISNMAADDAGKYEVKINSVMYNCYSTSSSQCNSVVLPLLEHTAAHAPVVFTVQEHSLPEYNPHSVISTLYVTENSDDYTIMQRIQFNISQLTYRPYFIIRWYSSVNSITNGNMYTYQTFQQFQQEGSYSLQIIYSNIYEIIGNYVGMIYIDADTYLRYLRDNQCQDYYNYIDYVYDTSFYQLPLDVSYWSIELSSNGSSATVTVPGSGCEADMLVSTGTVDVAIIASKELPLVLGDYITLTCSPSNHTTNTTYQFTWLHNHSLLLEYTTPTLVLPGVIRRDLGEYQCLATSCNTTGSASINITAKVVSITTKPSQGPFSFRRSVQFSCVIEPTLPDPVTYQWRTVVDQFGGRSYTSQSFSSYFRYYTNELRYCWYFCEGSVNQTLVGFASKLIELQGLLYTDDPVVRSFNHGEMLQLNVIIISDYYYHAEFITSLAWYHNGTRIISGNKFTITNNDTTLSISNMTADDAGIYEVKINSVVFDSRISPQCDSDVLPLLEHIAAYAPVVFTVQEHSLPEYSPNSVISTLYVTKNSNAYTISQRVPNILTSQQFITYWYYNGSRIPNNVNMYKFAVTDQEGLLTYSLQIMYNKTDEITGNYVGILIFDTYSYLSAIQCQDYYRYLPNNFPLHVSYWNIKLVPTGAVNGTSKEWLLVVVGVACSLTGGVLVTVLATIILVYKCYKRGLCKVQSPAMTAPSPPVYEEITMVQPQARNKTFELQENMAYGHAQI